ncbi:hypothetical protein Rhal01_00224 [Rubritalea halochordaticola]|uniref:DUF58 domain-containing protein n=1 Tax=Rubritalea halochordaticola TaxID=714537 RepID=A0ABP9UV37_9BACT
MHSYDSISIQAQKNAQAHAGLLQLPLAERVWRGAAGEFQGAGVGASMDFQDHRVYMPGDDPRHINWQAYARTGHYTMKLYREEVRPVVDIIFDISKSTTFDETKSLRAFELLHLVHHCATKAGASTVTHLINGDQHVQISSQALLANHWKVAENITSTASPQYNAIPQFQKLPLRGNALRLVISDCLYPGDPLPILRSLSQRKSGLIILSPFLESEANPNWQGNYFFIDSETDKSQSHRIEQKTLQRYITNYQNHFNTWREAATRVQALFTKVSANSPLLESLQHEAIKLGAFSLS